jgi:hypothetical protein
MDKDNANPTILTAAQLPTRQRAKKGTESQYPFDSEWTTEITRLPSYLTGPLCDVPWSSDESDLTEDDFTDEPIDEQEIYGEMAFLSLLMCLDPCPNGRASSSLRCGCHVEKLISPPKLNVPYRAVAACFIIRCCTRRMCASVRRPSENIGRSSGRPL